MPRLASSRIIRHRDGSVSAQVAMLIGRREGTVDALEEWTFHVSEPVDSEGMYAILYPRPGSNEILIRIRSFGAWLWSPGSAPRRIALPPEVEHASDLEWSPDGRWLVSSLEDMSDAIALWDPATGALEVVTSPAIGFAGPIGWTSDSLGVVLARDPRFPCDDAPWSIAVLDLATGTVIPYTRGQDVDARARGSVWVSVASGVESTVTDAGDIVLKDCLDQVGLTIDPPDGALTREDVAWSVDGRELSLLASKVDRTDLIRYVRPYVEPTLEPVARIRMPDDAMWIEDLREDGRFVVVGTEFGGCQPTVVVDLVTGAQWRPPSCYEVQELLLPNE